MAEQFEQLAQAVLAKGYSQSGFESLVLSLSPQQERLFSFLLERRTANTIEVRQSCSIGNVSECARSLNDRLIEAGDDRRVICDVRTHINKYGQRGQIGYWVLVDAKAANDAGEACK